MDQHISKINVLRKIEFIHKCVKSFIFAHEQNVCSCVLVEI